MAGRKAVTSYPVEQIPNSDALFLRVHRANIKDGNPLPRAYDEHDGGMSTNWSRYATAADTRQQAANIPHPRTGLPKNPADFAVLGFNVGRVRQIPNVEVQHTPLPDNRAHTDVTGTNAAQARVKLGRIYSWEIKL